MTSKEFTAVLIYMCNKWSDYECSKIFGPVGLSSHIWEKWINYAENYHGTLCCIAPFMLDIDYDCQQIIIDRATSLYDGRRNK